MKNTTTKAYTEVLELLKFFSTEQVKKIPEIKLKVFLKYRDESYSYKIDETKSFFKQDMMPETKAIFTILFEDYWATDEQKKVLKQIEAEAFKELEDKKRSLYNPDNLFKNKELNEVGNNIKNANITLLNEKWYNKIILALKSFFNRK